MPAKGKSTEAMEEEKLREEAMAEWLSRGLDIEDFSMAKMMKLWDEEDDNEEDEDAQNTLEDKQELMKGFQVLSPIVEYAKETASQLKQTVKEEAKLALATAWKYAELPPLKRRRLLREHVNDVHTMDAEAHKYSRIRQRVIEEFEEAKRENDDITFGLKKRNQRRAPLLDRTREMKIKADQEKQALRLMQMEQKRLVQMEKNALEKKTREEEQERKREEEHLARREMSMNFWKKHLEDARAFSAQQCIEKDRKEEFDARVEEARQEIQFVEDEENKDQLMETNRKQTQSSLGVYGTEFDAGEWNSHINGGHQTGMDEYTIGQFSARGFKVENEKKRLDLMEAQSKVAMINEKLEQAQTVKINLGHERKTALEKKSQYIQDVAVISEEYDDLNSRLAGPPRRDPKEKEKLQFHTLVNRRSMFLEQIRVLDRLLVALDKKMDIVTRSEAAFRPLLKEATKRVEDLQLELEVLTKDGHDLPIVVGKSIFQHSNPGGDDFSSPQLDPEVVTQPLVDPNRLYNQVKMETKLRILQENARPSEEHYRKTRNARIERWKASESMNQADQDLNTSETRLANIRDRLVEHQTASRRSDLMLAIQRFHQGPNQLRQSIFPIKGHFEWWQHFKPSKSHGLELVSNQNIIRIQSGEVRGSLGGTIRFPKRGCYRVRFRILPPLMSPTEGIEGVSGIDDWMLYVGPDFDSLQLNVAQDLSGKSVRSGDITFEFSGPRLCFCFEFYRLSASGNASEYCSSLDGCGSFEERLEDFRLEETRERLVQREKHFVSEFVKALRLQSEASHSERYGSLLQELILVENSQQKTWDSQVFHGHSQRFQREHYILALQAELKKEIGKQLDAEIGKLKKPFHNERSVTSLMNEDQSALSNHGNVVGSCINFQARKAELLQPHIEYVKRTMGYFCSFKSRPTVHDRIALIAQTGSYDRASLITAVRYEWRQGHTKVCVLQKLATTLSLERTVDQWRSLDDDNAVYLGSSFARALRVRRDQEKQASEILTKGEEQITLVQEETAKRRLEDIQIQVREQQEDERRRNRQNQELAHRQLVFYAEGMREATYNENVSAQIDFQVKRSVVIAANRGYESEPDTNSTTLTIEKETKERYARSFMMGRLQLLQNTWRRKEQRIQEKRHRQQSERAFRIRQEEHLIAEIRESKEQDLIALQAQQTEMVRNQISIPHFSRAVVGTFECEHREQKAWGTKYGFGQKCKACGKEMSNSFDDPLHGRGADPELDDDVRRHRAQITSGVSVRFRDATHLQEIENERIRLEKEARMIEECEAMLYDRAAPKDIDELNYRHGFDRKAALENHSSDDPLYQRIIHDIHHAAYQEDILHHGRLRNFHFRIQQINEQHAKLTLLLALEIDFLDRAKLDSINVHDKLPVVERDYARAVKLIKEDENAWKAFEESKGEVLTAVKEREAAHHAMEGVEEEAEFAEFHAPSLVRSSDEMSSVCSRFADELHQAAQFKMTACERLTRLKSERLVASKALQRLKYRTSNTLVHTRFGFGRVKFFREEDACLVVDIISWEGTVYVPLDEVILYEDACCEDERAMMIYEDQRMQIWSQEEKCREKKELALMAKEDESVRGVMGWYTKKYMDEERRHQAIRTRELETQLEYELDERKSSHEQGRSEANRLLACGRVAPSNRRRRRTGRLDLLRAARAAEKRIAMAAVERKLLAINRELTDTSKAERDDMYRSKLSAELLSDLTTDLLQDLCVEAVQQENHQLGEILRAASFSPIVMEWGLENTNQSFSASGSAAKIPQHVALGLSRLWVARRKQWLLLASTWKKEGIKLQVLRDELLRREELRRLEEEDRAQREKMQREMLAEERYCRQFYLDEMTMCMRERKAMASAEIDMRDYIRKLELEAMKAKYAKMVEDRYQVNDKAARRLEIKLGKNEKHRLYREWAQIKIEDEMGMQIRERDLAEQQAAALERQFDKYLIQQALNGKVSAELEASRVRERLVEAQRIASEKRTQFEAKLEQERMTATVETMQAFAATEVKWMDAMERAAFWKDRATAIDAHLKLLKPRLESILDERKHVVADAIAKRAYANECKARLEAATKVLETAIQKRQKCELTFKKTHKKNAVLDSSVLHDRVQLFSTSYLRDRLHTEYFTLLVDGIVKQATILASEREVNRLQGRLQQLVTERSFKVKEVSVLQRKRRRQMHMRMRRAELGVLMFGSSRRRVLKERFQQWVELWSRRTVVRASFALKHQLLLQEQALTGKPSPVKVPFPSTRSGQVFSDKTKLSILHNHQKRRLRCRLCKKVYSEEQNNRYACTYHPGGYEFACVRTCLTRRTEAGASAASVAPECMMHRAKRWLCCDETEEGRFGSTGCERRFHLPVREEPALSTLVATKSNYEQNALDQMNQQLLELRERDMVGKVQRATKSVVAKIEHELVEKRKTAAKYHTLDRRHLN